MNTVHGGSGPYSTIQAAIDNSATLNGDYITVDASTYSANEAITVTKGVRIYGINGTPIITPLSGVGIYIAESAGNVDLQNLKVANAPAQGIFAYNVIGLYMSNVTVDHNGTGANYSGISLVNVTGTVNLTNVTATNNARHGLEIGNGSTNVQVNGGTFTGNGVAGDPSSGGGIIIYAESGATTSGISIFGSVNASSNTTAGIYLYCESGSTLSNTTIGATGTVTLQDNGSTSGTSSAGAGVLIYGGATATTMSATFSRTTVVGGGLVALGTDNSGANSPTNTTVKNSTFMGYNNSTSPAITLASGTMPGASYYSNQPINATSNNTFSGATTLAQIEQLIYHKTDDPALGLVSFRAFGLTVNAKVFLQGPYSGSAMTIALATAGYIPLGQPYTAAPFSYSGTEAVGSTAVFTTNSITDWVLIELRLTATGAAVDRRAALLKNDGTLLDIDGFPSIVFSTATAGNYFIVVKHRNHLAIMSAAAVALPNASAYDFTTAQAQAYGINPMKLLATGIYGLIGGDANADGYINGTDFNVYNPRFVAVASGYNERSDFDLSGHVDGTHFNIFNPNFVAVLSTKVP